LFVRAGGAAIRLAGIKDASITGNRFESCLISTLLARPNSPIRPHMIELKACTSVDVYSNVSIDAASGSPTDRDSRGDLIGTEDCRNIKLNGQLIEDAPKREEPRTIR
jgi:hypothetical protein